MDSIASLIAGYYDQQAEHEWERMDRHHTEFAVTWRALEEYLPPPPARLLDCGGGPGRYAIELARRGYQVNLFDLSAENLHMAKAKAQEAGVNLEAYEQGTATDLSRYPEEIFDAVLLMGPMYHLLDEEEREQALREGARVLKPGGMLFAAFISRYAAHRDIAKKHPDLLTTDAELAQMILASGKLQPRGRGEAEFIAYFAHPIEIHPLFQPASLEILTLLGLEGLVSMIEEKMNMLEGEAWDRWVDLNYRVAADPSIHGCVEHLLAVSTKPRWRSVLRLIADQLNKTEITYKVVGGASIALQGVQISVKDLDLEMDQESAYRFQTLFQGNTVQPVEMRESETYRSFFGRFDFDGVQIEVMGDLHRREAGRWVPTWTATWGKADLDGVQVNVAWLEEETLAYIRRGRLERAALCLPYCDPGRLLALMRGEQPTNVI